LVRQSLSEAVAVPALLSTPSRIGPETIARISAATPELGSVAPSFVREPPDPRGASCGTGKPSRSRVAATKLEAFQEEGVVVGAARHHIFP